MSDTLRHAGAANASTAVLVALPEPCADGCIERRADALLRSGARSNCDQCDCTAQERKNSHVLRTRKGDASSSKSVVLMNDARFAPFVKRMFDVDFTKGRSPNRDQRLNGDAACTTRPPTTVSSTFTSLSCTAGIANRSRSATTKSASLPTMSDPLFASSPSAHALFSV